MIDPPTLEDLVACTVGERAVMIDLYGLVDDRPITLTEIARKNRLTVERIRQLEDSAKRKIGHYRLMKEAAE